jgi:hypothetical protein
MTTVDFDLIAQVIDPPSPTVLTPQISVSTLVHKYLLASSLLRGKKMGKIPKIHFRERSHEILNFICL